MPTFLSSEGGWKACCSDLVREARKYTWSEILLRDGNVKGKTYVWVPAKTIHSTTNTKVKNYVDICTKSVKEPGKYPN